MSHTITQDRSAASMAVGGLIAMAVGIGIGRFVYTPILPSMMADLGMTKSVSGLIASANFVGYLLGALAATRTSLPGPRGIWLPAALVVSAITTATMGVTSSVPAFVILRFLGGAASALALILSSAIVLDHLAAAGRPRLMSLHFAGVGIGIAISAAVVASQHAIGASWEAMWLASGGLALMGAVAVAILVPAGAALPAPSLTVSWMRFDPRLVRMAAAYGLFGFGYVITATFLVAIVRGNAAIQALEPVIWIVVGLAAAPSVTVWTALARRIGTQSAFAAAALAEAVGVLASVIWPSMTGICVAALLLGGTFMGLTALGLMRGRELAQGDPRPVMAALTVVFGVGQITGPALAGMVSDALGGFTVPSLMAAGGLILAAWLARR